LLLETESNIDYNKIILKAKEIMKIKIDSIKKAKIEHNNKIIEEKRKFQ